MQLMLSLKTNYKRVYTCLIKKNTTKYLNLTIDG